MSHAAEISRERPSAFMFLVDQSGSMAEPWGGGGAKAQEVSDALNRFLGSLVVKCTKDEGLRNYFDLGLIGYGATTGSAWRGSLSTAELWPITKVGDEPLRIEDRTRKVPDGAGGVVETTFRLPVWVEPEANGPTPMCEAVGRARELLAVWVADHPDSFPPTVINITDGEPTDGDPGPVAQELKDLKTSDGNLMLFNVHLSSTPAGPILFPASSEVLNDPSAKMLYDMSSELTDAMLSAARQAGHRTGTRARGMAFQSDLVNLVDFIDIGTRVPNLR